MGRIRQPIGVYDVLLMGHSTHFPVLDKLPAPWTDWRKPGQASWLLGQSRDHVQCQFQIGAIQRLHIYKAKWPGVAWPLSDITLDQAQMHTDELGD